MGRMSTAELVRKADTALSDLDTGGKLTVEQSNAFYRNLIDQPTILNEVRTVIMTAPQREVNKVGFGTRILRPFPFNAVGSRALASTDRAKPDFGRVTLSTVGVAAEVDLPYEVLEDNIEGQSFADTIMELVTERVALDLEDLIINGDTASSDTFLALRDGVLKQIVTNPVDARGAAISKTTFKNGVNAMPTRFLRNRPAMRHYVSVQQENNYRDTLSDRMGGLSDSLVTGFAPVYAAGSPVAPVALMPQTNHLFLDPKNIIVGLHRDVTIETDKLVREQIWIIMVSLRIDVKLEEEQATVRTFNLAA